MTVSPLDPLWLWSMSPLNLVTSCLLDKPFVSHLASLISLAKPHHFLVLNLTIWWLFSLFQFGSWQDKTVSIDTWITCSVGITGYWQNLTQRLSSWQIIGLPSGITDSFSKTSPSSCPPLDNLVVALFVSVWLMARQDCAHWHLEYLLCWGYLVLAKPHSKAVFLTNHWSPIWPHWFL